MLQYLILLVFIALAAALVWYLISHDHGQKEPVLALWMAAGLGLVGGVVAGLLESRLLSAHDLTPGAASGGMLATALGVGIIEESCKFIPLALAIYKKPYFNEHTDGVIYFALAGLGFGLPENILYTLQFGNKAGLMRVLLTPLFHAGTTAFAGYFLAKRKLAKQPALGVALPLGAMMILHAFYDFGLAHGSALTEGLALVLTLGISADLFLLYAKATAHDQELGLSVVGHNSFCRSCGFPNPSHHLYCTHCGSTA